MSTSAAPPASLRVSYVWRDEVMADHVFVQPQTVSLGNTKRDTLLTPPTLGVPDGFAVLRPGSRGYVLTLGSGMTGSLSIAGVEQDVAQFLRRSNGEQIGVKGDFVAHVVGPGDWGVVHLDGRGEHTLFFQFVASESPLPRRALNDGDLILPAIAFALILHGFFLAVAFTIFRSGPSLVFPGDRELVANYILNRPPPAVIQEAQVEQPKTGLEDGEEKAAPSSTAGEEGKQGGEGEKERLRAPDPDQGVPEEELPAAVQVGLLSKKSRDALETVRNRGGFSERLGKALARNIGEPNQGSVGGSGAGSGLGVGDDLGGTGTTKGTGKGPGGGGKAHEDIRTQGKLDTGGTRAAKGTPGGDGVKEIAVQIKTGTPSGSFGGLTAEQILKVVKSRERAIQSCYQRELQRSKNLSGKIVVTWKVDSQGKVQSAKVRSTTMKSGPVEDCIVRQVASMRFPSPKGGTALVNFPFLFAQQ